MAVKLREGSKELSLADNLLFRLGMSLVEEDGLPGDTEWAAYRNDPVGFCSEKFGHTYPEDIKELMRAGAQYVQVEARSANAVGKTFGIAAFILWYFLMWEDSKVFCFAAPPESNLKNLLWGAILNIIRQHPDLFAEFRIVNMRIERNSESYIEGVTIPVSADPKDVEARFSGKHAPHLLFAGDEADAVPPPVYKGIESCMSGGDAHLLLAFNPRAESGIPYQMERTGTAKVVEISAFNHPNVVTGNNLYPGAVTRETTCRRVNEWSRPMLPQERITSDAFELPEFLAGYRARSFAGTLYPPLQEGWRVATNPALSYMVLGRYPSMAENQLISRTWVEAARTRWDMWVMSAGDTAPAGTKCVMGLDVAEFGLDENVAVGRYGGYVRMPIAWGGVDILVTGDNAARLYRQWGSRKCQVDGTGVGAGVAPHMRRQPGTINANRIMFGSAPKADDIPAAFAEMGQFRYMRDLGWWALREWLRTDAGSMLPPDEQLIEEVLTPSYQKIGERIAVMDSDTIREKIGRSPDRASALVLTFCPDPDDAAPVLRQSSYA